MGCEFNSGVFYVISTLKLENSRTSYSFTKAGPPKLSSSSILDDPESVWVEDNWRGRYSEGASSVPVYGARGRQRVRRCARPFAGAGTQHGFCTLHVRIVRRAPAGSLD
ncbi:unnamed protein product [Sphagnum compactum]